MVVPVTYRADTGQASNAYSATWSSGFAANPSGVMPSRSLSISGISAIWDFACSDEGDPERLVIVPPGATPLTLTSGATSFASCLMSPITACFDATYSGPPPPVKKLELEAVKIMDPLDWRSAGRHAYAPSAYPFTFTPKISSQTLSSFSSSCASRGVIKSHIPALPIKVFSPPNLSTARAAAR